MNKRLCITLLAIAGMLSLQADARGWFGGGRRLARPFFEAPLVAAGWDPFFWHRPVVEEVVYQQQPATKSIDQGESHPASALVGMHSRKTKDEYIYTINVPGYDDDSITVTTDKNVPDIEIALAGQKEQSSEDENDGIKSKSFSHERHSMIQSFTVPRDADLDQIKATVKNGVLTVRVKRRNNSDRGQRRSVPVGE